MSMLNILIGFDQFLNTILGGTPDETLSARAWRLRNASKFWGRFRVLIDAIFFLQDGHCESSYKSEMERKHLPKDYVPL